MSAILGGGLWVSVRPVAELTDLEWIDSQLGVMQAEVWPGGGRYPLPPADARVRRDLLLRYSAEHILLLAVGPGGDRRGFVLVLVAPHVLNPALLTAYEALFWVTPEHRGGRSALALLDSALAQAKRRGCVWVWWSSQITHEVGARALARRGFRERERQWLLELDPPESGVL